jgi:cyclopropane-fatty-acyl-phospholipid synthase
MKNYEKLLEKIQTWLKPKGYLFVHIFVHHKYAYHFEIKDDGDWISKHFFSGGTMPSDDLLHYFQKDLQIVGHWRVNGRNYEWTSNIWLENFYKNLPEITKIFEDTYPKDQIQLWLGRWRLFYLVVAEYFGVDDGDSYYVSHYLFQNNKQ